MNIFQFKKQKNPSLGYKQKLLLFFTIILITISIFPVIGTEAIAQGVQPQGPAPVCRVYEDDFLVNANSPRFLVSQSRVQYNEKFDIYFEAAIPQRKIDECTANGKDDYRITIYAYNDDWGTTFSSLIGAYSYAVAYKVELTNGVFRQKIKGTSLQYLFRGAKVEGGGQNIKLYAYWHRKDEAPSAFEYIPSGGLPMQNVGTNPNPNPSQNTLPDIPGVNADESTLDNNESKVKADELKLIIQPDSSGKGLRSKYRVALTDSTINFGSANGPDAINADWDGKRIEFGQFIGIPYDSKGTLTYDYEPKFQYVQMAFADGSKPWDAKAVCLKDSANYFLFADDDCSQIMYINDAKGIASRQAIGTKGLLPGTFDPTLKSGLWTQFATSTAELGKPLGEVSLYVIPVVWGNNGYLRSYVMGKSELKKVTLEVFKTDDDIREACKNDPSITDKSKCDDLQYAKFGFSETITQANSSSETADRGATQTLYEFIVKIISAIVIFLTSAIYRIFAMFVVPVINALLDVRPYQDAFVNIIYPGWLILRNLANIFFIIALLVVGLRILFQQSAAGTARGFILRLVIMALLVNFSLVIAQGVVGIADTVQSQFLPGNTRVIEALGSKLMVEPIVSFRTAVGGGDADGQIQGDANIGDIAKPIVLLMLALAAFFSFLAIAAFLAVRLVALMILYMVSPIAYVSFVMDETRSYTSKWWSEFMKYAFVTPILVFFLNIAALVATTTSSGQGNVIKIGDNLEAGIVAGGLTIVSHFIVILIIFAGMKFAMSSGHAGAGKIVDYAKKGFKNSLTKWPGAAKDTLSDMGARGLKRAGFEGASKALTAATKPLAFGQAVKKKWIDDAGDERRKRESDRLSSIPFLTQNNKIVKDPLKEFREKEKEINEDNSGYLADLLKTSAGKRDKATTGAAMMRLAKNGDFDDMLSGVEQAMGGGVKYSKDAAGLNKATKDIAAKLGMSDSEQEALLRNFDTQAGKDKAKKHYSGNVDYKDGKFRVKALDGSSATGKFSATDHKEWYKKQAGARLKMGISEDAKNTGVDSMVIKKDGQVTGFTDTQLSVFNGRNLAQIADHKEGEKFRATGNFKSLDDAYSAIGGLNGLRSSMVAHNNAQSEEDRIDEALVIQKAEAIDRYLFASSRGNGGDDNITPPEPDGGASRQRPGFINGTTVRVTGGGTVNPGTPTASSAQSAQMNAAQNVSNTVQFSGGAASNPVGDIDAISGEPSKPLVIGHADSNIGPKEKNTSVSDSTRRIGFIRDKGKTDQPTDTSNLNAPKDKDKK